MPRIARRCTRPASYASSSSTTTHATGRSSSCAPSSRRSRSLESGTNVGFARATNAGIRVGHAPFVLALNPDTSVPTERAGATARRSWTSDPEVGICGCRLVRRGRELRPRGEAFVPDRRSARSATSPGSAAAGPPGSTGAPYRAPDVERGPGRRRQRRVHAHAPCSARRGRPVRRGVLDVHGGPRPLLPLPTRRAGSPGTSHRVGRVARQGRHERAGPRARG